MRRPAEPLRPLQAKACSCAHPLVEEDSCTWCGRLLPGDPALQTAAAITAAGELAAPVEVRS